MSKPPSSLLDAVNFLGCWEGLRGPWHHSCSLHVLNLPQRPRHLTFPEEVRVGPSGARIP